MSKTTPIAIFSEIFAIEQRLRSRLNKTLPKGLELSHFSILNHLHATSGERTPAQLAKSMHVTRGAITNTLARLEKQGYIHIRRDWDDARQKFISISQSGKLVREIALAAAQPIFDDIADENDEVDLREVLTILRGLRQRLD